MTNIYINVIHFYSEILKFKSNDNYITGYIYSIRVYVKYHFHIYSFFGCKIGKKKTDFLNKLMLYFIGTQSSYGIKNK